MTVGELETRMTDKEYAFWGLLYEREAKERAK